MRRVFYLFTTCILFLQSWAQSPTPPSTVEITYQNPVIAGDFADPSVIRVGDTYYAVGTSSEWGPAYPIYTSNDLVNWTYLGPVFTALPEWLQGSCWAPELVYQHDTFYVYYTARRKSDKRSYIGVATSRDLRNGFTDHGLLLEWTSEAIDAFIVEDNGKRYITWKAYGLDRGKDIEILGAELSADGLKVTGKAFPLVKAERNSWEAGGIEGQAIVKRGGYYYMLYSGNACCGAQCNYQVGLARAKQLQGPWEKYAKNPVLMSDKNWRCPGHGTVVTTPTNRYFYLHHAYHGTDFTFAGRQGVLSELIWDDQTGWPAFRYGTAAPIQAESPYGVRQRKITDSQVSLNQSTAEAFWVWDVSLPKPSFRMEQHQLQLPHTSPYPAGSFLGVVIRNGTYTFSADVTPQQDVLQSICLYGDGNNALGMGIKNDLIELWQVKEGTRTVLGSQSIASGGSVLTFQLQSRFGQYYTFSWSEPNGKPVIMNQLPVDGSFLPRWDRAPRVGLSVGGAPGGQGLFRAIRMHYD